MKKSVLAAACLLAAFILWTAAVCTVDVRAIGPMESSVGLASVNRWVHNLTGVHMRLYTITDWLGLAPIACMLGFALLGLTQWIRRKSLLKVDFNLLALGGFYIAVLAVYVFFETFIVNYRPVLVDGVLEASYPSSTTVLVMCVMPTAAMQLKERITKRSLRKCTGIIIAAFTLFMVIGRLVSGVHWFSDIIGGVLVSAGLVMLYSSVCAHERHRKTRTA